MLKNWIGYGLVVVLAAVIYFNPPKVNVTVNPVTNPTLSGVSGPDLLFDVINFNGVEKASYKRGMTTGTTTPFAFKPASKFGNATSTLTLAHCYYNAASSTASTWTFAKSRSFNATTTKIGDTKEVAASTKASMIATTTPAAGTTVNNELTFGPNDWFVVGVAGGSAGSTFNLTGLDGCEVEFTKL